MTDRDRAGRTPLHYAVIDAPVDLDHGAALKDPAVKAENDRKIVDFILTNSRRLLDAGSDVNAADDVGSTALHFAAKGESEEVVELLISAGADVNAVNNKGETPLNDAVGDTTPAKPPIVRILRDHGADPTIAAQDGYTALKYVQRYGHPELRELFADLL